LSFLFVPRAMWNSAKVLDVSWFLVARVERDDWNNWNFGRLGTRLASDFER
jgi:hypothetical protein